MSFLWYLIWTALAVIPLWQICPKFRLPEYAALAAIIPGVGLVALLWVFAYREKLKIPGIDT